MAKKLIKYGKFLMSVALIFCLMAPSYASLSASDGSAFVTKSEFDSALADFNARLTTFEAGINSKIDSQVTSYLDRNGIWAADNQDMVTPYYWHSQSSTTSYTLSLTQGSYGFTSKTGNYSSTLAMKPKTPSGTYSPGKLFQRLYETKDLVTKTTKTGLMHIQANVYNSNVVSNAVGAGLDGRDVYYWQDTSADLDDDGRHRRCYLNYQWWGMRFYELRNGITNADGRAIVQLMLPVYDPIDPASNHWVVNAGCNQLYFFVSKNSKIYFDYLYEFIGAGTVTIVPMNTDFRINGGKNTGVLVVFDTCEIF